MDPEGIMLSEISQTEKDKYLMILLICGIYLKKKQAHRCREQIGGCVYLGRCVKEIRDLQLQSK